jgi:cell division protein FtsB
MAAKKELTGDEEAELAKLWKKLVKLYHPDRFAHEPDKLETYGKLTAAINRAKDSGDLDTLRQIAGDPHGFILRQGWAGLDFRDEEQAVRLRKLLESLEAEIVGVIEATNRLRESAEFELHALVERKLEMFESVVARQIAQLEAETASLQAEAAELANEIESLTGQPSPRAGERCLWGSLGEVVREVVGFEEGPVARVKPGIARDHAVVVGLRVEAADVNGRGPFAARPREQVAQGFARLVEERGVVNAQAWHAEQRGHFLGARVVRDEERRGAAEHAEHAAVDARSDDEVERGERVAPFVDVSKEPRVPAEETENVGRGNVAVISRERFEL